MSIHLPPQDVIHGPEDDLDSGSCLSPSDEDEDQNDPKTWDDWVSDSRENVECYSLFGDKKLSSVAKALEYDEQAHGFNLDRVSGKLGKVISSPIHMPLVNSTEVGKIFPSSRLSPTRQTHQLYSQTGHAPCNLTVSYCSRLPIETSCRRSFSPDWNGAFLR